MSGQEILQRFEGQGVLIVGDVMLDRHLMGSVSRISPEAPVPVVLQERMEDRLGGAANVALNIRALGGIPILCSVIGADADGALMKDEILAANGMTADGLVCSESRVTTVKTRILGNHQQMLRVDKEDTHDLSSAEQDALQSRMRAILETGKVRVIILQDYNKGVLTPTMIRTVLDLAKQYRVQTAVDPKKANFFAYQGVDLFKPNLKEVRDSLPFPVYPEISSLRQASAYLKDKLRNRITMLTLSEKGLFLEDGNVDGCLYPTQPRNISDVSGAGDTVISVAALGLAAGLDMPAIARLSNLAGGQVCEVPGVVPVEKELLAAEYDQRNR